MSYTSKNPVSKYSTANLPNNVEVGTIAYDTDQEQLVFYKEGGFWDSLGGAGIDAVTDTYMINESTNEILSISGDIPQDWGSTCSNFTSVVIGSSAETIGRDAFNRQTCSTDLKLKGSLNIPVGVKYIRQGAFFSNNITETIVLPEGLIEIEAYGFGSIGLLLNQELGLVIPSSVTTIGALSLSNFYSKRIDCYTTKNAFGSNSIGGSWNSVTKEIHVPTNDTTFTAGPNQTVGGQSGIYVYKDL